MFLVVLKPLHHDDANGEPTPTFASDAEIELAAQLRHELEARLLEASSKNTAAGTTATIDSITRWLGSEPSTSTWHSIRRARIAVREGALR